MSLLNLIKKQLIEIIEWTDDSRDTLAYRWPDEDKEIKNGAQLIVRESQMVQFVAAGQYADLFGPGKHTLKTENIPILSTIYGWKYGFASPFKCDVYYINTRLFTGNKWGTSNPVMLRDKDFGVVRIRAFGTYDFRIVNPALFLKEVAGTDHHFRIDEFADTMRSRIVSVFSEALARAQVPVLDVAMRYGDLGAALLQLINPVTVEKYGLEMSSFVLENVSVPPEVEAAIDKRASMGVIGNLNDYVKYQMGQGLGQAGTGADGGAAAAAIAPATMAMGFGMAQQMMQQMHMGTATGAATAAPTAAAADPFSPAAAQAAQVAQATQAAATATAMQVYTPDQAAQVLGVGVADVLAELESGQLKGRKIGSQWRISQAALDAFLNG